ncbi:dipeptide ABC transporter ATP-binding protein [Chelatococcus asaccharovorans]|uniref:dipeptide ABC transporter ATP-binding protein n=1 Tax=Chelatococcus asaccharovorans TaxID=28210 RepID=UPI00224C6D16|nr:ABC transporter ATP-binding protein [Chelatococcus asaccharovorans]CAH1665333.1 Peptide/nickel transport system ATP-binding protein/oligopeptide transport system ATP-binding protein [Chelatococcus asaccharovorans]CAH1682003.1 Peptide/nickel transport system ATP-binding protein/oligopeptide transport system ATP-binding protein [Chelatococcus asaccharovorans]
MSRIAPPRSVFAANNLTIAYRNAAGRMTEVLKDVTLALKPGGTLGIVGESGSGKSTFARALLGHLRPGSSFIGGSLDVLGTDMIGADRRSIAAMRGTSIAMAMQNPLTSLTYHMRVGDQVLEVLKYRAGKTTAEAQKIMLDLFIEVGLPDPAALSRRYPHQLSGGQRQRVVIAAALACNPALIVLDEPTSALDKTIEAQVLDLVDRIRRQRQMALVMISHDLRAVSRICSEVAVLEKGVLVETGATAQVFECPAHPYTKMLLKAAQPTGEPPRARKTSTEPSVLEACGLHFSYPAPRGFVKAVAARPALTEIDFSLAAGETLGVIGGSGSGKTTLGMIVAGLLAPSGGTLSFQGGDIGKLSSRRDAQQRRRIQIVFQDPLSSLNPRQTCAEAVIRPARFFLGVSRREAEAMTADLFARLGLPEALLTRFPRQLSGGQQQRVAIARAFVARPDLLVCDEITSALDASVQMQVLSTLADIQHQTGVSIVMITHDLGTVWERAQQVIVLEQGRIVDAGRTADVFRQPKSEAAKALFAAGVLAETTAPTPHPAHQREELTP